ncbi:MAG TPA: TIGR00730 family Rossman fold protein [Candidatus Nanopelagicaceae bacterium]|nr:TIGR00730 family Rossman fold protein [Candidatus Nanopelagicaceae bacterium]
MRICVYCSSSLLIGQKYLDLAAEVGREIAAREWSLVSGGGNLSMMGAVARSVRKGGGHTIGVIPRALVELEVADTMADELIVVDDMRTRKALMESHADAFLALPGGLGTLEELFEIWVGRHLGFHDLSIVVLDPDGLFAPLRDQIALLKDRGFARAEHLEIVKWTTTVDEALDACGAK